MADGRWPRWAGRAVLSSIAFSIASGARPALACPVCFGISDSPVASAMNLAILMLLGLTGAVLAGFVAFFVYLSKRARLARELEWDHEAAGSTGY